MACRPCSITIKKVSERSPCRNTGAFALYKVIVRKQFNMGRYINQIGDAHLPAKGKADVLIANGAKEIPQPTEWQPNLVCVVDNGLFEAAAYCFDKGEFDAFTIHDNSGRPRKWLVMENVDSIAN